VAFANNKLMKRDQIKDRILKRAARAWGSSSIEMESSFDPMVSLMINGLSHELEKISEELQNLNIGVVERILEIMFPEASIGARPVQAILHASPLENNVKVSLLNQLTTTKRIPNIYNPLEPFIKEIAFSPTLEVKLASCEIKYIAYGSNLYELSNVLEKKAVEDYHHSLSSGEVFLGIELSNANELELEDLMLYIDIKDIQQKEMLEYYLKNMKCFYDDAQVKIKAGYNVPLNNNDTVNLNKSSVHLSEIIREVNEYYFDNFYTLKEKLKHKGLKNYNLNHECFAQVNNTNDKPIIWIKMIFPESLVPQVLDNVIFQVNCFPVINKKRHTINKVLKNTLSYMVLNTEKSIYLDIENVIDSFNNYYEIKDFKDSVIEDGTAVLRTSGASKFDERSATELIQKVLDLLKDEGSSFSYIGKDFASKSLGEISQLLLSVQQQADQSNFVKNNDPHLIIKPRVDDIGDQSFEVNYWSTSAEDGNNIKTGTILEPKDKLFDSNKSILLVTTSVGGLSKQSDQNRIFFYRNALLTRGRVVTIADIKAFSFNHFKACISAVRIEKGTRKEISFKEGFSRTIDIYLKINKSEKEKLTVSEWGYLCESFMKYLKRKSSNVFPYRLFEEN
jgi:hypothetical protein